MELESWEGFNSAHFAAGRSADQIATMLGGVVVETAAVGMAFYIPPQRLIYLGNGVYLNAGLVAVTFANNPFEIAWQMIMTEVASGGSFSFEQSSFELNTLQAGTQQADSSWNPHGAVFITPWDIPLPANPLAIDPADVDPEDVDPFTPPVFGSPSPFDPDGPLAITHSPEPATWITLACGLALVAARARRRRT